MVRHPRDGGAVGAVAREAMNSLRSLGTIACAAVLYGTRASYTSFRCRSLYRVGGGQTTQYALNRGRIHASKRGGGNRPPPLDCSCEVAPLLARTRQHHRPHAVQARYLRERPARGRARRGARPPAGRTRGEGRVARRDRPASGRPAPPMRPVRPRPPSHACVWRAGEGGGQGRHRDRHRPGHDVLVRRRLQERQGRDHRQRPGQPRDALVRGLH